MNCQECATTKKCTRCGVEKEVASFVTYFDNRRNKDYIRGYCRSCENAATVERLKQSPDLKARKNKRDAARRATPEYKQHMKQYAVGHRELNREKIAAQKKVYRAQPEVKARESKRLAKAYTKDSEGIKAKRAKYYSDNPDKKEARNARIRDNYAANPEYSIEKSDRRRRNIKQATPAWYDEKKVIDLRKARKLIQEETGVEYHLDHIVPINGKHVCGLHWHGNMQIITQAENLRKSNAFG